MPKYSNAVGYLNDLAIEINEPWFKMACDLAAVSGTVGPDQFTFDTLFALYTNKASYIGIKPAVAAAATAPAASMDFLERLAGFANFKLLGNALEVGFNKQITLIFGANGSGKSSLCESLKVLATAEPPNRPLENLRAASAATPSFLYKFKSDPAEQTWTSVVGYGPRQTTVKYFDAAIAARNVKKAVEPGRVIVLTPFRLQVFQWVKDLSTKLREALQRAQLDNSVKLTQALEAIRTDFAKFKSHPLSVIDDKTFAELAAQITLGEGFVNQTLLSEKQTSATEVEKAASEEGLKLLRAEHRELETFLSTLSALIDSAARLWVLEPANKAKTLVEKQAAQEALAKALIPKDGTLDSLLALIQTASTICKMEEAAGHTCPLCRRELGVPEVELFKQYHELLAGELEKDISALKRDIDKASEFVTAIGLVDRAAWDKYTTIPTELLTSAKVGANQVVTSCDASKEPTVEAKASLDALISLLATWSKQLELKKKAIEVAAEGREPLLKQLLKLRSEIEPLEYAQAIADRLQKLKDMQSMVDDSKFWSARLPTFAHVLKRITEKAKDAHEELVVVDFEARLETEYKALAEKNMAAFGVILARKGVDAAVTVLPQIGGRDIEDVLSEGEQRIHALALFFAELETCTQSVFVFDDPVSSFDYNYIANYCARLRELALKYPAKQIVVLTHNWEFFVQLQTTLNVAGLDSHLSVQVLENCTVVSDYSEKIDDLKRDIEAILASAGEPSKTEKEETAGKMRRLIEAVVNTHVFNNQRHQYKQKSQAITAFQSFTKIVALLPAESTTLRDLYAKLSITEHDDPRSAYVNTDKAMFQTRYDQIVAVETAIKARIP